MPDEANTAVAETIPTFAEFHKSFSEPAPAEAEVEVNPHGTDNSALGDEPAEHVDGTDPSSKQVNGRHKETAAERVARLQKEINREIARKTAAKTEADAEEERLRKLKTEPRTTSASATPIDGSDPDDPEPTEAQHADWQQLQDARAAWIGRKEFRKLEHQKTVKAEEANQARAKEESQRSYKTAVADFEAKGNEFAAEEGHEDYPELVAEFKNQKVSNETEAFLLWGCQGTEGPEILHRFMKEPEKLKEIEKMPSAISRFSALYAFKYESRIADLEAQLEAKGQAPAKPKQSTAPPVGTRLRASNAAVVTNLDDAPNYASFKKLHDQKNGLRK